MVKVKLIYNSAIQHNEIHQNTSAAKTILQGMHAKISFMILQYAIDFLKHKKRCYQCTSEVSLRFETQKWFQSHPCLRILSVP
jgi:hypothetical protein